MKATTIESPKGRTRRVGVAGNRNIHFFFVAVILMMALTAPDLAEAGEKEITAFNPPPGGGTSGPVVLTVKPSLEVAITSPQNGATVNRASVIVKGTYKSESDDVGISVNGVVAEILDDGWVASGVPLSVGDNTIKAVISDPAGNTSNDTITVHTDSTEQAVRLSANVVSGIPPLEVYFTVDTYMPGQVAEYQMDFDGDGTVDYSGADFEDVTHTYTAEGVYYPTVTVTDGDGNTYSDTIAVTVLSREKTDTLLRDKWASVQQALLNGDVEGALAFFVPDSRKMFRYNFNLLSEHLGEIVSEQKSGLMTLLEIENGRAEYDLRVVRNGEPVSFMVEFYRDFDGVWKLNFF